jgi:RNA 3'-terminal phosphate cyclase (ATP)
MKNEMIVIDGSFGEGGGQILRTSLALSLVTGKCFRIENIRAGRKKPGLLRQHLTATNAAAQISNAVIKGNHIGSQKLHFEPGQVKSGRYCFAVGSAGSATLVLQTILPALLIADGKSELVLEGGTHNPFAPPFDFLQKTFLPIIHRMGVKVEVHLERPGFYPAGGGKFNVTIEPQQKLQNIELLERGRIVSSFARAVVANLPINICERELGVVRNKLNWEKDRTKAEQVQNSRGPGNVITLEIISEYVTEVFTGFGKKGVPAERVPQEAIKYVKKYLTTDVPVGKYLADQLMVPMAMAGGGKFRTLPLTRHSTTNIEVIKKFLDINIDVEKIDKDIYEVRIG